MTEKTIIGLLGGIASGKSTVANMMEELGAEVVDADRLAHEALQQPSVQEQIKTQFGTQYVSEGTVNRSMLADVVFDDPQKLKTLKGLTHPYVLDRITERIQSFRDDDESQILVLDVPLLLETGLHEKCDLLVFMDVPEQERVRRVREQRDWTEEDLRQRESQQKDVNLKKKQADVTIQTNQSKEETRKHVSNLLNNLPNASDPQ